MPGMRPPRRTTPTSVSRWSKAGPDFWEFIFLIHLFEEIFILFKLFKEKDK